MCQTFRGQTVRDAATALDDGERTCRTHGSWAYRNGTLAYAFTNDDGEFFEVYCADCAERQIRYRAASDRTYSVDAMVLPCGDECPTCDDCGDDVGN
jgi:hypothetical protein